MSWFKTYAFLKMKWSKGNLVVLCFFLLGLSVSAGFQLEYFLAAEQVLQAVHASYAGSFAGHFLPHPSFFNFNLALLWFHGSCISYQS